MSATPGATQAGADEAQPANAQQPLRRSKRNQNKTVQSTKGTTGMAASRVSLSRGILISTREEANDISTPAPAPAALRRGEIVFQGETSLDQYVRVTIQGEKKDDNSVGLFYLFRYSIIDVDFILNSGAQIVAMGDI